LILFIFSLDIDYAFIAIINNIIITLDVRHWYSHENIEYQHKTIPLNTVGCHNHSLLIAHNTLEPHA
jgi:hypothetical protein